MKAKIKKLSNKGRKAVCQGCGSTIPRGEDVVDIIGTQGIVKGQRGKFHKDCFIKWCKEGIVLVST